MSERCPVCSAVFAERLVVSDRKPQVDGGARGRPGASSRTRPPTRRGHVRDASCPCPRPPEGRCRRNRGRRGRTTKPRSAMFETPVRRANRVYGGSGRRRRASARASPRQVHERTSPSPAPVRRHDSTRVFGTNSAEKMLCVCPVYTDPRQGNAVPSDHTQTHRSSPPLSNKEASSFRKPRSRSRRAFPGRRLNAASHQPRVCDVRLAPATHVPLAARDALVHRGDARGKRVVSKHRGRARRSRTSPHAARLRSPPIRKTSREGSVTKVTTSTAPRSGFPARRAFPRPRSYWRWRRPGTAPTSPGRAAASVEARGSEPNLTRHTDFPKRQKKRWLCPKVVV